MIRFTQILHNTHLNDKKISMIQDKFDNLDNLIFYGPHHSRKYEHALKIIQRFSPTSLNYEKKIMVSYNGDEYNYRISDIHIEINFEFLGCVSKNLWAAIYNQVILQASGKQFIFLCKNFSKINNELLETFYTYVNEKNINIRYILLTDNLSSIPKEIIDSCLSIPVKSLTEDTKKSIQNDFLSKIVNIIENYKNTAIKETRNILYELLIYQVDIYDFFYVLLEKIYEKKKPNHFLMIKLLNKLNKILKLFNNNYRSIYHLENFIITIVDTLYV